MHCTTKQYNTRQEMKRNAMRRIKNNRTIKDFFMQFQVTRKDNHVNADHAPVRYGGSR